MTAYVIRRLIQAVFVLLGVTIVVFIVIHLLPGGLARDLLGLGQVLRRSSSSSSRTA
jgi:peptide/nickel transport system permease protein